MARKPRIHYNGAIYHVIARGNNREPIFLDSADKAKYLELLSNCKQKYEFSLYAYVLMDNHSHFIVQVSQEALAKPMQSLQQRYTRYFNDKYQHCGHVFQQRYKAFLCTDESYLRTLLCYVHQNPTRARIAEGIAYCWSSHHAYVRGWDTLVNVDFILNFLDKNREQAIRQYLELVQCESEKPEYPVIIKESNGALPQNLPIPSENLSNRRHMNLTYDEIIENICVEFGITADDLLSNSRERSVTSARNKLIYEVVQNQIMTQAGIAARLNIDAARISRVYQQLRKISQ